jgi:hypothetical protein
MAYAALANLTVAAHFSFVLFVIFGGLLVQRWHAVAWLHVPAVLYAILIQTIGFSCFLTGVEKSLRELAGQQPYAGEFLPHYVWSNVGLAGSEPIITVGLLALTALFSLRPYLAWAAA